MENKIILCLSEKMDKSEEIEYFANYFFNYFKDNQKEFVCTISAIIRDDIMTLSRKGEKPIHLRINRLEKFEGSDNPWCIYDPSKFQLDKIEGITKSDILEHKRHPYPYIAYQLQEIKKESDDESEIDIEIEFKLD